MFKKRKCKNCNKKINSDYDFCPYCGNSLNSNSKKDWGMIGRDDNIENSNFSNVFGINGNMLNKMLGGAMRMLQKELQREMKNNTFRPRTNFKMMINGKEVKLRNMPNTNSKPVKKEAKKIKLPSGLSEDKLKKFLSFEKVEPSANVRRLSDKVIYEIDLDGVESIEDVSILRLESSIEIKALAKNKSYVKIIPINFDIINYSFSKGKLILEFGTK